MGLSEDHADVQTVYLATYKKFMEAIDAVDNGDHPTLPVTRTQRSATIVIYRSLDL